MKTLVTNEKRSAPTLRKTRPYVHHLMGPAQQEQQAAIRTILRPNEKLVQSDIVDPDDKSEQEIGHAVADLPVSAIFSKPPSRPSGAISLQRSENEEPKKEISRQPEEEEQIQEKLIQRMCPECEVETAQRQSMEDDRKLQAKSKPGEAPTAKSGLESKISSLKGGGQPLDPATRDFFEPRFGHDFNLVRIHADSNAANAATAVNAQAYTYGNDVVFGRGQYSPDNHSAKRLVAHELTHVVQQGGKSKNVRDNTSFRFLSSSLNIQKGPPQTESGRFVLAQARDDLIYLTTEVVAALRATADPIRVNTADAIRDGILALGIISRHPEPERHATDATPGGTYYFPDTDLNTVLQSHISTGGAANVPGSPPNKIYVRVRRHFSLPRHLPSFFFQTIVHEAQHYMDHHSDEVRSRGIDSDIFDLWLNYKTEFNAYWTGGGYDYYPVTPGERTPPGPRMLRWQAIRQFLMETSPYRAKFRWLWSSTPPSAPTGSGETLRIGRWRNRMYPAFHDWFARQIDSYHEPEAFNRINSPRIEQFYRALRSAVRGRPARVREALAGLGDADIAEIRSSSRLERVIRSRIRGALLREVLERTGFPP